MTPDPINGVLVVDKPERLTSHDVVAAARRALRQTRIGHTGTLDPLATGVLPLAIGRATRLVRFLTASDKDYDATIRFGLTTDTYDITGAETARSAELPGHHAVAAAIASLRGEYLQMPPPYSAKKVGGRRAYEHARRAEPVALTAAPVRVPRAELLAFDGGRARVALTCSAGFYVRSFAHALGELVGTGACLEALRRTRSGEFTLDDACGLDALQDPAIAGRVIPLERLLPRLPAVRVSDRGREFVRHGRELSSAEYEPVGGSARDPADLPAWVRILDSTGSLLAVAAPGSTADSLHPSVVLV